MNHKFSAYTRYSLKLIIKPEEHVKHFQSINFHDLQNQNIKDFGILRCKENERGGGIPGNCKASNLGRGIILRKITVVMNWLATLTVANMSFFEGKVTLVV